MNPFGEAFAKYLEQIDARAEIAAQIEGVYDDLDTASVRISELENIADPAMIQKARWYVQKAMEIIETEKERFDGV